MTEAWVQQDLRRGFGEFCLLCKWTIEGNIFAARTWEGGGLLVLKNKNVN